MPGLIAIRLAEFAASLVAHGAPPQTLTDRLVERALVEADVLVVDRRRTFLTTLLTRGESVDLDRVDAEMAAGDQRWAAARISLETTLRQEIANRAAGAGHSARQQAAPRM